MSITLTIETLLTHSVVPRDHDGIRALYANALNNLNLSAVDYLTIRDLLQYIDHPGINEHALLICMFAALTEGSVCVRTDKENINRYLLQFVLDSKTRINLTHGIIKSINSRKLVTLMGQSITDYKPLIRPNSDHLYFQKYFEAEFQLQQSLESIIKYDENLVNITNGNLREIIADVCKNNPFGFNDEQWVALIAPLLKRFIIISGGPGTGKTSIIITIIRLLARCNISPNRIKLAAPTGRAAQKLTESLRTGLESNISDNNFDANLQHLEAETIHRLLGYKPSQHQFTYNQHYCLPIDVLIVDEISMVDIVLMTSLLLAVPKNARIIFLGDRNQLPSVDAGAVLSNLLPDSPPRLYQ